MDDRRDGWVRFLCVFLKSLDSFQDPDPFAIIRTQLFFDVNA